MKVDKDRCIACKRCFAFCPMGKIQTFKRHDTIRGRVFIEIDQDACTDCGMCIRAKICPVNALYQPEESWPREVRSILSNPLIEFKGSNVPGRGTEEMKTTDVKGTFPPGVVGVGIELGRPGTGAFFRDVEKVAMALAPLGYEFAEENPVTQFMDGYKEYRECKEKGRPLPALTGKLLDEVLGEKATSAIIEGIVPIEKLPETIKALQKVAKEVNTVFTIEVITKVTPEGEVPIKPVLDEINVWYSLVSKNNIGIGEPYFDFYGDNSKKVSC